MIGLMIANLLIPGDPASVTVNTPRGPWTFVQLPDLASKKAKISQGAMAETYALEHPVSLDDGAASFDLVADEITPILLGASYLTGLTVTSRRPTMSSEYAEMQLSHRWPRPRSIESASPVVNNVQDFEEALELFITAWFGPAQPEKPLLLVHHWLDAIACWSLEDLILGTSTLFEIIRATQEQINGGKMTYNDGLAAAATRVGVQGQPADFRKMRNDLVHFGVLSGTKFPNKTLADCAKATVDALNWFDQYAHAALNLGSVRRTRLSPIDLANLNSFSL